MMGIYVKFSIRTIQVKICLLDDNSLTINIIIIWDQRILIQQILGSNKTTD